VEVKSGLTTDSNVFLSPDEKKLKDGIEVSKNNRGKFGDNMIELKKYRQDLSNR